MTQPFIDVDNISDKTIDLVRLIQRQRLDLSDEKSLQAQLADVFSSNGIEFEREKVLSPRDIPDFMVSGGIVIECKLRGARKMDVYKQLCRYAEHASVRSLVLASNLSLGLPPEINGKPVFCASFSKGWL